MSKVTAIAKGNAGTEYGHVPGHQYHDVDAKLYPSRDGGFRVTLHETWGSAQGYDEEHGSHDSVGYGDTAHEAARDAQGHAKHMDADYVEGAIAKMLSEYETDRA